MLLPYLVVSCEIPCGNDLGSAEERVAQLFLEPNLMPLPEGNLTLSGIEAYDIPFGDDKRSGEQLINPSVKHQ